MVFWRLVQAPLLFLVVYPSMVVPAAWIVQYWVKTGSIPTLQQVADALDDRED